MAYISSRRLFLAGIAALAFAAAPAAAQQNATLYEGARLITGDGTPAIENSAILVQNGAFIRVGRRGDIQLPAGANRVDLSGKTVMPTLVDMHGHFGFQNLVAGTMSKDMFNRDNLIDHLQRLAYVGVGAVVGVGDLADRSDMHGGRTHWSNVALTIRNETIAGAALVKAAGPGMACPGTGA